MKKGYTYRKVITTQEKLRDIAVKQAKEGFEINITNKLSNMRPCDICGKIVVIFRKKAANVK